MTDPSTPTALAGDLTDNLIGQSLWTDEMVAGAGIPIADVPFVTIGGGMGSFAMVDLLRLSGVPTTSIRVLTMLDRPYDNYEYLATNSQIPRPERLRSDSASEMDNIWGWPSYALREAFDKRFRQPGLSGFLAPIVNVATEPILTDYWTPQAGQVFTSVDREAARIQWPAMVAKGQVRMVRRRHGGGYFTILTPPEGAAATRRVAFRSTYVHISVGYPGLRFLPDLQEYREKHRDFSRVVNAYEPHEHVYEDLLRAPGTVVVRGSGIVALRVLQRLIDDREKKGAQTQIIHLFRNYVSGPHGESIFFRRPGKNGFAYQGFNFCKAAWGGVTFYQLAKKEGQERVEFIRAIGGTNIPKRKYWLGMIDRGLQQGFYLLRIGEVAEVTPGPGDKIITKVRQREGDFEVAADYIIDATGLEAEIEEHRLLADLLQHSGAGKNPYGRLDIDTAFGVRGTESPPGQMYAVGTVCLGSHFAPNDSFLGLQFGCLEILDDLAARGFCTRFSAGRSLSQWLKWARNTPI